MNLSGVFILLLFLVNSSIIGHEILEMMQVLLWLIVVRLCSTYLLLLWQLIVASSNWFHIEMSFPLFDLVHQRWVMLINHLLLFLKYLNRSFVACLIIHVSYCIWSWFNWRKDTAIIVRHLTLSLLMGIIIHYSVDNKLFYITCNI